MSEKTTETEVKTKIKKLSSVTPEQLVDMIYNQATRRSAGELYVGLRNRLRTIEQNQEYIKQMLQQLLEQQK